MNLVGCGNMVKSTTKYFNSEALALKNAKEVLKKIFEDLEERGYDPIKQITGYLISGDPGYISSYKECRSRLMDLDRNTLIEAMLKSFVK